MTKLLLMTCLLLISLLVGAQEFKESDLDKLIFLPGKVKTYCSEDSEKKARYLQNLVQDAVIFYEDKLQDTFEIKLLVLNKQDWKLLVGGPYVLSDFARDPDRIEMGTNKIYKIKLTDERLLYGQNEAYYWDFIAVHELGHYISHLNNLYVLPWMGEFFADYIMLGFLSEKIPEWQFPSEVSSSFFKYLPLRYKSLEDLGKHYSSIDPINYILYEGKLIELADKIYKNKSWSFMYEYIERFKVKPAIDKAQFLQKSISDFKEMEPNLFNDWLLGMRKTYHPYLVFFILLSITGVVRYFDNSYSTFTNLGLKTGKSAKIFGVSTFSIVSKIRTLDNSEIKRKLKLIIWLRPLFYLSLILIIFLLILHH